jgi:hypothetical protein
MKGVVADLVVRTHGENGLPGCLQGSAMDFIVRGSGCISIPSFVCETRRELPPDELRDR